MNELVKLSIVTTLYKSEEFINEFYQRMVAQAEKYTSNFEIVFVDDGSPDGSAELVKTLIQQDSRLILVELSRNFGHHYALVAGLSSTTGERVFLIDSDLEEQPEWLGSFCEKMQTSSADVIFGVQSNRKGSFFKRYSGELFYKLFNAVSDTKIPNNLCTVRLMTQEYVQALLSLPDKSLFLAGNCAWAGFDQQPQEVQKVQRRQQSTYNLVKMMGLFLNAITSFTSYPLHLVFFIGLAISTFAGLFGSVMIIDKLMHPEQILLGYASMMVSIWFLSGLMILFVGIIGLYLSKMFLEIKGRPQYIVRKIHRQ